MPDLDYRRILVFDIEVAPYDFHERYDEDTKDYLLKWANGDEQKEKEIIDSLVFSPWTSFLVAIGMLDFYENKGAVLINTEQENNADKIELEKKYDNINYYCRDEKTIIEIFWKTLRDKEFNLFVTFNGREFDCPYLMLRSLILRIRPTRNLMAGTDFNFREYHIDLLKELTFLKHAPTGARRKFSLDFYCKQLGIESPKSSGITGDMIGELYKNKEYQKIADYCIGDVMAEAELFKIWKEYLNF
ncbi:MAG: ribonuclease H-like domain-containing protein [Ignavibacteria bacterium]|nr:ribonuclease H-like domain-containing protein [Ignavibacteria bacterium]